MPAPRDDDPSSKRRRGRVRRLAIRVALTLGLATAALVLAPSILAPTIAHRLATATGADVRIGWITCNPLRGIVTLHRIALAPAPSAPAIVTADALVVDVALGRWLHGDRGLDAVVLHHPWVALRRTGPGDFNVAALFSGLSAAPATAPSAAPVGPPTPFHVGLFRILNGSIEFRDETVTPTVETSLYLDDASARDLDLANGGSAGIAFHVESRLENEPLTLDVSYDAEGDTSRITAKLVAKHASLARALLYVPLGWQRTSGSVDATVTYERRLEKNALRRHTLTADLALQDLALTEPWMREPMLRARQVRIPAVTVDLVKQTTDLGTIAVDDYEAVVLRDAERVHAPLASGAPDAAPSAWRTTLDRVALGKGRAVLRNVLATPEVTVPVASGTIRLAADGVRFDVAGTLAGGGLTLAGRTEADTTTLAFGLRDLALPAALPLIGVPTAFAKGRLDGTVELALGTAPATFTGHLVATDAATAPRPPHPEEVVAWQRLEVEVAASELDPLRIHASAATATWPYVMIHRRSDGIFPFAGSAAGSSTPTADAAAAAWLRIDHLAVDGGRIEFYDDTLPKAYGIDLTDLAASADGVSVAPVRAERVVLKGAFDELSPVDVTGRVDPGGTRLAVAIDRLLLPPLNPYLAPALGYEVKSGLARITSDVQLEGSKVVAATDLVLSRFAMRAAGTDTVEDTIGTKLSVALALMKDTRGDIHLKLPIEGDVASSEYRVGSLLREALGTALLGTLRAPLGFLRGIFRKDEGERFDLRPVPFAAGSTALGPDGDARIAELAKLLERQSALHAVLISSPGRADFEQAQHAGAARPLDTLAALVRDRAAVVVDALTRTHGVDGRRVTVEPWQPAEPDIEGDPGVDVQLRTD